MIMSAVLLMGQCDLMAGQQETCAAIAEEIGGTEDAETNVAEDAGGTDNAETNITEDASGTENSGDRDLAGENSADKDSAEDISDDKDSAEDSTDDEAAAGESADDDASTEDSAGDETSPEDNAGDGTTNTLDADGENTFIVDDIEYKIDGGGVCIVSCKAPETAQITEIPAQITYDGKVWDVTTIGDNAFEKCKCLYYLKIPGSIKKIGYNSFANCQNLTTLTLEDGITDIGNNAFMSCGNLQKIIIPGSCRNIGKGTFFSCTNLTTVTLQDGLQEIGNAMFSGCEKLQNITIPESVTVISDYAFSSCYKLQTIAIPSHVTTIGKGAYSGCRAFKNITIPDNVTDIGAEAFSGCSALESIVLPKNITTIKKGAFSWCNQLKNITIPNSVTELEDEVFFKCDSLETIRIPEGVTKIGENVFKECWNLSSIDIPSSLQTIGDETFMGCLKLMVMRITITETSSAVSTGTSTFSGCPKGRYLEFYDSNGIKLTGTDLENAKHLYDPHGYGMWRAWYVDKPILSYTVALIVQKDDQKWTDHGKSFALISDANVFVPPSGSGETFSSVQDGSYTIYEVTNLDEKDYKAKGTDTGIKVTVNGANQEVTIDYYTVTFYDGATPYAANTPQEPQIVLKGKKANRPAKNPEKKGFTFSGWVTEDKGADPFPFENPIIKKTDIYASWKQGDPAARSYIITATAGAGGTITPNGKVPVPEGADQSFQITPDSGYRIKSVKVDGLEVPILRAASFTLRDNGADPYPFTNVTEDHTIDVQFEKPEITPPSDDKPDKPDTPDDNKPDKPDDNKPSDDNKPNGEGDSTPGSTKPDDTKPDKPDDNKPGDNQTPSGGDDHTSGGGGTDSDSGDDANTDSGDTDSGNDKNHDTIVDKSDELVSDQDNQTPDHSRDETKTPPNTDHEPRTEDSSRTEIFATLAMVAGFSYLLLYFTDEQRGMTESEKEEIVARLIRWAKSSRGYFVKRYIALTIIFVVLFYYHSIGKQQRYAFS